MGEDVTIARDFRVLRGGVGVGTFLNAASFTEYLPLAGGPAAGGGGGLGIRRLSATWPSLAAASAALADRPMDFLLTEAVAAKLFRREPAVCARASSLSSSAELKRDRVRFTLGAGAAALVGLPFCDMSAVSFFSISFRVVPVTGGASNPYSISFLRRSPSESSSADSGRHNQEKENKSQGEWRVQEIRRQQC